MIPELGLCGKTSEELRRLMQAGRILGRGLVFGLRDCGIFSGCCSKTSVFEQP
jgi:hypothetical protein